MISVVIPTYKKVSELIVNLKHNLPHLAGCEVIVVNDDPQTDLNLLKKTFPQIKILTNHKNLGFAGAVNRGIEASTGRYVFLLNSDVRLNNDQFKEAVGLFKKNDKLFAVAFAQKEKDGSLVAKNRLRFSSGHFSHSKALDVTSGPTAWAEGGSSIFDRQKLVSVGLFNEIFAPFYWEDIDLSYRAWKMGYEVIFDSSVVVEHHHESTIGNFYSKQKIETVSYRNSFLFTWKNLTDPTLIASHLLLLPLYLLWYGIFKINRPLLSGFGQSFLMINEVLKSRRHLQFRLKDQAILKKIS